MNETFATIVILAGIAVALYLSAARNPLRRCPRCGGKGTIPSAVLPGRYRPCPRCGRKGEIKAWGSKKD